MKTKQKLPKGFDDGISTHESKANTARKLLDPSCKSETESDKQKCARAVNFTLLRLMSLANIAEGIDEAVGLAETNLQVAQLRDIAQAINTMKYEKQKVINLIRDYNDGRRRATGYGK